jgi:hypothetical protein
LLITNTGGLCVVINRPKTIRNMWDKGTTQIFTKGLFDKFRTHLLRQNDSENDNTDADAKICYDFDGQE